MGPQRTFFTKQNDSEPSTVSTTAKDALSEKDRAEKKAKADRQEKEKMKNIRRLKSKYRAIHSFQWLLSQVILFMILVALIALSGWTQTILYRLCIGALAVEIWFKIKNNYFPYSTTANFGLGKGSGSVTERLKRAREKAEARISRKKREREAKTPAKERLKKKQNGETTHHTITPHKRQISLKRKGLILGFDAQSARLLPPRRKGHANL